MKWCLYDGGGRWTACMFGLGLTALGEDWSFLDGDVWRDDFWEPCDVGVVFGVRAAQQSIIASLKSRNVPTVVVDLGFTRRFCEHNQGMDATLQLSIGDWLNILPTGQLPEDRRKLFGLEYPKDQSNKDGYILVCGQWPSDPTHPFRSAAEIEQWVEDVRGHYPDDEVCYRPHPRHEPNTRSLEEDMAGAQLMHTWSSNAGHDALVYGLPVIAEGPEAPYRELCGETFPSAMKWKRYFNRLAYAQWTLQELADGDAQRYLLSSIREGATI